MKKFKMTVGVFIALAGTMAFNSCIGSFALTSRVMSWNNQVGSKFVNELVFLAFWILPVYEVTSLADLVVINAIEFWSGSNPVTVASVKTVDTLEGKYLIACDKKGYTIKFEPTGEITRLDFCEETDTWSVIKDGQNYPFMTFVDENHVKMITPEGDFHEVELSDKGVLAYQEISGQPALAVR